MTIIILLTIFWVLLRYNPKITYNKNKDLVLWYGYFDERNCKIILKNHKS